MLLFMPSIINGQNTLGFPEVINYSKFTYNAGLQNWDFKQDTNGVIYVANNEGLLTFDGINWVLHPLPNKTIVRSVEIGRDGRIYVGGQDELGYFEANHYGKLIYHSLVTSIPKKYQSFSDVWDIVYHKNRVYFRTLNKIFEFNNDKVAIHHAPSEWSFLSEYNEQIYAHDYKVGLMILNNGNWVPVQLNNPLPTNDPVTGILSLANDTAIITTLKNGIYCLQKQQITKINTPNNAIFINERIYAAVSINSAWVALATSNGGVYVIDKKGDVIQQFSRTEGLQNNNILSVFLDKEKNLWLGVNNGIDFIAYNSAIKHISPLLLDESGYTTILHNQHLYIGTSNGLYSVPIQPYQDISFSKGVFAQVANTKGQSWKLAAINNQLLLGHHEGAFVINNNKATLLTSLPGFWNYVPTSTTFPTPSVISGNYKGLFEFNYINQQFIPIGSIAGFDESSRFLVIDVNGNIWVSHPYHGIFKLVKSSENKYQVYIYGINNGLPSTLNNHIYNIKNEIVVGTEKGVYVYNTTKNLFEKSSFYNNLLGQQSIRFLYEDKEGNIWFIHEKTLGLIDYATGKPNVIYLPELTNKMLSGFECIYAIDEYNILLGGEKGFYHINYKKYKNNIPTLTVQVRSVRIIDTQDSLLFGGFVSLPNQISNSVTEILEIDNHWKTIHLKYSSTLYGYLANLEFSFRLKGFEKNWSIWTKRTEKEYTNLPPGKYTFEVKVRNNFGNESTASTYTFNILPPWYKIWWAYCIYLLAFIAGAFKLYKWQRKKFILQQVKFEQEQQKLMYIYELERNNSENELIELKNEKLEADINFKNTELASSAMHLVKKSELLNKIKTELTHVTKKIDNEFAITELKKMIKTLSVDENLDKEWEYFTKHFDKVHSDFIVVLKEHHPDISNNEMKLCAYLRMNLSTKEIAQLMNISIRGVEISRYRLRKKLNLSSEINLFDYLINIGNKSSE